MGDPIFIISIAVIILNIYMYLKILKMYILIMCTSMYNNNSFKKPVKKVDNENMEDQKGDEILLQMLQLLYHWF